MIKPPHQGATWAGSVILALGVGCALMAVLIFAAAIFPGLGRAVAMLR